MEAVQGDCRILLETPGKWRCILGKHCIAAYTLFPHREQCGNIHDVKRIGLLSDQKHLYCCQPDVSGLHGKP
jgi:hypothetical protein